MRRILFFLFTGGCCCSLEDIFPLLRLYIFFVYSPPPILGKKNILINKTNIQTFSTTTYYT